MTHAEFLITIFFNIFRPLMRLSGKRWYKSPEFKLYVIHDDDKLSTDDLVEMGFQVRDFRNITSA
jgi:hypothetical protein